MPSIALLFPGQGAQFVGMGAALTARSEVAKQRFVQASEILGYDLLELCRSGPEERLNATVHSQPALFVHSMAVLADLIENDRSLMDAVKVVAGLSLGEYSALAAACGLTFEEGVRLVQVRGAAMQAAAEAQESGMASVLGLSPEQVGELCDRARQPGEILQIANILCPGNIAISGNKHSLAVAEALATEAGAMMVIPLAVAGAFHTDLMQPAVERLSAALAEVLMSPSRYPVISNVDAAPHTSPEEFKVLLARQIVSPVKWESTLRQMQAMGVEQYYEIGAGRVLSGTLKRIDRKLSCRCVGD